MNSEVSRAAKRIRLTGHRFDGGRLPIDSLAELQRYQVAVRRLAEHEWLRDHPNQSLPEDFQESLSLAIQRIGAGSADVFLVFEQMAAYETYQAEARDAIDATIQAAYTDADLPELPTPVRDEIRQSVADIGTTLEPGQAIEFYIDDDLQPVEITTATRPRALEHLLLYDFFLDVPAEIEKPESAAMETTVVAHITAIDADKMLFLAKDLASRTIRGRYRDNPGLLKDLRAVVDSESDGPLTRISGELRFRNGEPWRFWKTYSIERVEFDDTNWGRTLTNLAGLSEGWDGGVGDAISSVALDAAQTVLRNLAEGTAAPTIGPTHAGGILLEWIDSVGIRSIEIVEDGSFELFRMARADRLGSQRVTADAREAASFANEANT